MRTIKFRVWDKEKNKMYVESSEYEFNTDEHFEPTWILHNRLYPPYSDFRFNVMQFTGVCDRNSIEIYEGDIVRIPMYHHYLEGMESHFLARVEYSAPEFMCFDEIGDGFSLDDNCEVIGNIYENKDLGL